MWNFENNPEAEDIISQHTSKAESGLFILKPCYNFSYRAKTPLKKASFVWLWIYLCAHAVFYYHQHRILQNEFVFLLCKMVEMVEMKTQNLCAVFLSLALFLFDDREYKTEEK